MSDGTGPPADPVEVTVAALRPDEAALLTAGADAWTSTPGDGCPPPSPRHHHDAEGGFVGYRGYDARDVDPLHAFGSGLSYTTFAYGPLVVDEQVTSPVAGLIEPGGPHDGPGLGPALEAVVAVSVTVTNTGDRPGDEVVQLYVADRAASVARPPKELAGFAKVHLAPGETTTVRVALGWRAFAFWDEAAGAFRSSPGVELLAGSSSRHLPARALVELT